MHIVEGERKLSLPEQHGSLEVSGKGNNSIILQEKRQVVVADPAESPIYAELDVVLERSQMYSNLVIERLGGVNYYSAMENNVMLEEESRHEYHLNKKNTNGKSLKRQKTKMHQQQDSFPLIKGDLRDYQRKGVLWLIALYEQGLNGILADEMGLGKTIQTIAFISHLRFHGLNGPFVIVAPLSTLQNWVSEFQKWLPSINVILYHGDRSERKKLQQKLNPTRAITQSFPVMVTSYEIAMNDVSFFKKFEIKSLIIDEGHRLKNHRCKMIKCLKELTASNIILLTGTPLQNNLTELWSILNFILPEVFATLDKFKKWFDFSTIKNEKGANALTEEEKERNHKAITKLHNILKPFLLRRLKSDVDLPIPPKQEIVFYVQMTEYQKEINKGLLEGSLIRQLEEEARLNKCAGITLSKLRFLFMQMRKNCNHPDLITGGYDGSTTLPSLELLLKQCGKLQFLDRLYKKLKKRGHKILIFSQMTRMLDILEDYFTEIGEKVHRLDGSVKLKDRQEYILSFNKSKDIPIFLISTRAGGLGINLTAADTVILYDSDWNPQQDFQAMDRCHRIGQEKPVLIFRLITGNSAEGKMLQRAASKLLLEKIVMKEGEFKMDQNNINNNDDDDDDDELKSIKAEELLSLLNCDVSLADEAQNEEVSEILLDKLLDRSHLKNHKNHGNVCSLSYHDLPYPISGPGYEVFLRQRVTNEIEEEDDDDNGYNDYINDVNRNTNSNRIMKENGRKRKRC